MHLAVRGWAVGAVAGHVAFHVPGWAWRRTGFKVVGCQLVQDLPLRGLQKRADVLQELFCFGIHYLAVCFEGLFEVFREGVNLCLDWTALVFCQAEHVG